MIGSPSHARQYALCTAVYASPLRSEQAPSIACFDSETETSTGSLMCTVMLLICYIEFDHTGLTIVKPYYALSVGMQKAVCLETTGNRGNRSGVCRLKLFQR